MGRPTEKQQTVKKTVRPPKAGRLATESQPSPEAKRAGWEKRKRKLRILDTLTKYMAMSRKEFFELIENIKKSPESYSMGESILAQYVTKANNKDRFVIDWLDRNLGKASQSVELTGKEGNNIEINITRKISEKPENGD